MQGLGQLKGRPEELSVMCAVVHTHGERAARNGQWSMEE